MEISQFVPGFLDGDAISNYAVQLQKIIQGWGLVSHIYGVSRHVHSLVPDRCLDVRTYRADARNIAIYHFSVGSEMTDFFMRLPEKKVLIYHNVTPPQYFHAISEEKASVLRKGREELKKLASVPDLSLAVSPYNVQELGEAGFKNPKVFPLLLNLEDLNRMPNPKILRQFKKKTLNILFVGRVAPNKKIEDVILSFYYVKKFLEPKARLFIVGAFAGMDRYLAYLRALAIELDLQDIFFQGHVTEKDLVAYYRLAHLFLCMSEHEGFCIPLLEAMHFNVPVLAFDATGVPGTLGGAGVLVKRKEYPAISEMIMTLYKDKNFREAVIQKQKGRLKDFDRERWAQKFKRLLEPLFSKVNR
ncbi:MAG: glycosyltransferase family 4 protein [Chlamydiae bacterium]|nr:glycosyltransferase family 4 protein [Chlamydiota bacterium]MBI3277319.1 glycosyltransferase family 4 protein [Chlamydiota bacterium]